MTAAVTRSSAETQNETYSGIRLSGMPAFAANDQSGSDCTWQFVSESVEPDGAEREEPRGTVFEADPVSSLDNPLHGPSTTVQVPEL
jgi:hypothetical protein